jgi:hypothetical protein
MFRWSRAKSSAASLPSRLWHFRLRHLSGFGHSLAMISSKKTEVENHIWILWKFESKIIRIKWRFGSYKKQESLVFEPSYEKKHHKRRSFPNRKPMKFHSYVYQRVSLFDQPKHDGHYWPLDMFEDIYVLLWHNILVLCRNANEICFPSQFSTIIRHATNMQQTCQRIAPNEGLQQPVRRLLDKVCVPSRWFTAHPSWIAAIATARVFTFSKCIFRLIFSNRCSGFFHGQWRNSIQNVYFPIGISALQNGTVPSNIRF